MAVTVDKMYSKLHLEPSDILFKDWVCKLLTWLKCIHFSLSFLLSSSSSSPSSYTVSFFLQNLCSCFIFHPPLFHRSLHKLTDQTRSGFDWRCISYNFCGSVSLDTVAPTITLDSLVTRPVDGSGYLFEDAETLPEATS